MKLRYLALVLLNPLILLLALILLAPLAWADGGSPRATATASPRITLTANPKVDSNAVSRSTSAASSAAEAAARSAATGGDARATGGEGGDASSRQTVTVAVTEGGDTSNVTMAGDVFEATDLSKAPGAPAAVYLDACASGASVSGPGFGASIGARSDFCQKMALASAFARLGDAEVARALLIEARRDLTRRTLVSRWLDWLPLLGRLF